MVVGIAMVRDEADIIEATVTHMLAQVHAVIVADNGSTDGTREILESLPITVRDDSEVGYFQSRKMSALAGLAADLGADWVVPFDADEIWTAGDVRIADALPDDSAVAVVEAALYDHVATGADPDEADPVARIGWRRRTAAPLPKVACRPRAPVTIQQGNHDATYGGVLRHCLTIRHFPYRSPEQFEKKVRNGAAAYAATDLPEAQGKHWRDYGRILAAEGPEALAAVFRSWFWTADPSRDPSLMFDPCPASRS